jgi:hypothetical protein
MSKRPCAEFYAEIYKIETRRDGSGRITLDFNADALIPLQMLHRLQIQGEINLACAMVPWYSGDPRQHVAFEEYRDENPEVPPAGDQGEETED